MKNTFCLKTVVGIIASVVAAALISPNVWAASCNPKAKIHQHKASTIKDDFWNASKKDLNFLLCMTPEKEDRQYLTERWQQIQAELKAEQKAIAERENQERKLSLKRYARSTDGEEVTDNNTGLVWRRCSEGQTWNGITCTGSASLYDYEQALALAQTQTGWRLPTKEELSSIVDHSRSNPAIDHAVFPGTAVEGGYWSSSPYAGYAGSAWVVLFSYGSVGSGYRGDSGYVRLVR